MPCALTLTLTLTLLLSRSLSRQSRALSRTLYRYDSPRSLGLSTGTSPVRLAAGNLTCALVLYSTEYSGSLQDGAISHLLGRPSLWLLSRLVLQDLDFSRPSFDVWSTLLCCSYLYHRSLDFGQLSLMHGCAPRCHSYLTLTSPESRLKSGSVESPPTALHPLLI